MMAHHKLMQYLHIMQSTLNQAPRFIGVDQQLYIDRFIVINVEKKLHTVISYYPDLCAVLIRNGIESRLSIKKSLNQHLFSAHDEHNMNRILRNNTDYYFYISDDKLGHTDVTIISHEMLTLMLLYMRINCSRNCMELKNIIYSMGNNFYSKVMHLLATKYRVFYIMQRFKYLPKSRKTGQSKVYEPYPLHKAKLNIKNIVRSIVMGN